MQEHDSHNEIFEGVEYISNLITRYTIIETLYMTPYRTPDFLASQQLKNSVVSLYAAVLKYFSDSSKFYGHQFIGMSSSQVDGY